MQIYKDFPLSTVLWYKIGGRAKYLLECETQDDILQALEFIQKNKIGKTFVVGLGSNLLFTDEYYDGAVIRIVSGSTNDGSRFHLSQAQGRTFHVSTFAGEVLDNVIQFAFENNLIGLEWAGGLPGTIGAGVRGNVGAFGGEIKDSFDEAEIIDSSKRKFGLTKVNRRNIKFSYRTSTVKTHKNLIVAGVTLALKKANESELSAARQTYFANIEYRNTRHPMDYPSNGSAFKNISKPEQIQKALDVFPDIEEMIKTKWHGKVAMGYLIKRLDMSGFQIGGAQISQKHSNFIINVGGARFTDVLGIIRYVQEKFEETFGFIPEPEVEIVA